MHQAPGAGSGDEANRTSLGDLLPRRLGPGQQDQEAEEPESLKPEEAAGAEPPKLPAHDGQDWMRALDGLGSLGGDSQGSRIHGVSPYARWTLCTLQGADARHDSASPEKCRRPWQLSA